MLDLGKYRTWQCSFGEIDTIVIVCKVAPLCGLVALRNGMIVGLGSS